MKHLKLFEQFDDDPFGEETTGPIHSDILGDDDYSDIEFDWIDDWALRNRELGTNNPDELTTPQRNLIINKLFSEMFFLDDPKNDDRNRAYLDSLSNQQIIDLKNQYI